jgi:folate-dependent phosphoribosylglycinamide formyltransferase PurN
MKILLLAGSHSRHLHFFQGLLGLDADFSVLGMQREAQLPSTPDSLQKKEQGLYTRHFEERFDTESRHFGSPTPPEVFEGIPQHFCDLAGFNSFSSVKFVEEMKPDIAIVFGTTMIRSPLFEALPKLTLNLHLGLSPWYRGAATLFWPFYFLEPNYAGATFHQITAAPDAGAILHQSTPVLEIGDGIHDVAAKTVKTATLEFRSILEQIITGKEFDLEQQKSNGKLFLSADFKPAHLRLIYDEFDNRIVDEYLAGNLGGRIPKLKRVV